MYQMIHSRIVSMYELDYCYSLDDALKLFALYQMEIDIQKCKATEIEEKAMRGTRG